MLFEIKNELNENDYYEGVRILEIITREMLFRLNKIQYYEFILP